MADTGAKQSHFASYEYDDNKNRKELVKMINKRPIIHFMLSWTLDLRF